MTSYHMTCLHTTEQGFDRVRGEAVDANVEEEEQGVAAEASGRKLVEVFTSVNWLVRIYQMQ